ncbi:MAG: carboxylate-amine ligase [Alphaproteobacteria bacterium]|nr:carboxylate-amine ligase [Alphaproteobacteria bacterium]
MKTSPPPFTIGMEEEYLLVDRVTRDLVSDPPPEMMQECEALLQGQVMPEFLRAQIEVATRPCATMQEARADLARLRRTVAEVAAKHGLAPIAAGLHPFAVWESQRATQKERYVALARDLQAVGQRLMICGLHVHVGIGNDDLRIDLMNQVSYFLPHLLALSTSSPFWRGRDTGLKSYRVSVFNELPRTGLPQRFESFGEYARHVDVLVRAGLVEDASKLWWDVRPSARFPTLEMRITDACSRLDDALSIAAIYRCLLSMLWRLKGNNQRWRLYADMLVAENRWRAQRYGTDEGLVDFGKGEIVPYADLLEEIIALVESDAERLDSTEDVLRARDILGRGTSAHRQVRVYDQAVKAGAAPREALIQVVDFLIAEFTQGI